MTETLAKKKTRALKIIDILEREYPEARVHLDYENPFQLLISAILAAQCTDVRVNEVMGELYKKYKTPADFLKVKPAQFEQEIRAINFYRNKTKSVIGCCKMLFENHGGKVPESMEELVELPGVGRKTANVVRGNCFGYPAIMTDTHVIRVSQRLGLAEAEVADKLEMELKEIVPEPKQVKYSLVIGEHGRAVCHARKPKCSECVVSKLCPSKDLFK